MILQPVCNSNCRGMKPHPAPGRMRRGLRIRTGRPQGRGSSAARTNACEAAPMPPPNRSGITLLFPNIPLRVLSDVRARHFEIGAHGELCLARDMKNSFWCGWLAVLLLALGCGSARAQTRIATVDLRKVFDGYWKTKQADAALKDRAADLDKEYKALREDYEKLKQDYQKLRAESEDQAVAAEERDRRKQAAEAKLKVIKETEDAILAFERRARATLDEQQRRMRDGIIDEIRSVITARAKSGGYALVLDTSAQTPNLTPIVLYYSPDQDITTSVLDQLNLGAPPEFSRGSPRRETEPKKEDKK